jgi:chitodextrinase
MFRKVISVLAAVIIAYTCVPGAAFAENFLQIEQVTPSANPYVGKQFEAVVAISASNSIQNVSINVDTVHTELAYSHTQIYCGMYECKYYKGTVDLGALTPGAKTVTVTVTDVTGATAGEQVPLIYHEKPELVIEQPDESSPAAPKLHVKASCKDSLGYVCQVRADAYDGTNYYPLTALKPALDEDVHFGKMPNIGNAERSLSIVVTAVDSVGQTVSASKKVVWEPSPVLEAKASVGSGVILSANLQEQKLLYIDQEKRQLGIKPVGGGTPALIPHTFEQEDSVSWGELFAGGGAVVQYKESGKMWLGVWRDGMFTVLDEASITSPVMNGHNIVYQKGLQLLRRNVDTGQANILIQLPSYYYTVSSRSVTDDGTVYFAVRDSSLNTNSVLYRYSSGQLTVLDKGVYTNYNLATDGNDLVYAAYKFPNAANAVFNMYLRKASGEVKLLDSSASIFPRAMKNGWIGYSKAAPDGTIQGWIIAPNGTRKPAGNPSESSAVEAIAPDGQAVYSDQYADYLYISREDSGARWSYKAASNIIYDEKPYWLDGKWYFTLGNTLFEAHTPADTAAPVWPSGSQFTIRQETDKEAVLTWTAAQDNTSVVRYDIYLDGTFLASAPGSETSLLVDKTAIGFGGGPIIVAIDADGNASAQLIGDKPLYGFQDSQAPSWPADAHLTAVHTGSDRVKLSWPNASDDGKLAGYRIYDGIYLVAAVQASEQSATVGRLKPETAYSFRVEAFDTAGNQSMTGPSAAIMTKPAGMPEWPSGSVLAADQAADSSVHLSWSAARDDKEIAAYRVFSGSELVAETPGAALETTVQGLKPAASYTFKVEAGDADGNWTDTGPSVSVTTLQRAGTPEWPANSRLTAANVKRISVDLAWTEAADDKKVTGYRIYKGAELLTEVPGGRKAFTVHGLASNTAYTFRVEAGDADGHWTANGPSVSVKTLAALNEDKEPPAWPASSVIQADQIKPTSVRLSWTAPEDQFAIKEYRFYVGGVLIYQVSGYKTSDTVKNLVPNTTYVFKIEAVDAAGNISATGPSVTVKTVS